MTKTEKTILRTRQLKELHLQGSVFSSVPEEQIKTLSASKWQKIVFFVYRPCGCS